MITFDGPEGATLRALNPSRSAVRALWFAALTDGQDGWGSWAADKLKAMASDREVIALRFMQAAGDGNTAAARQLWAILASFPMTDTQSTILKAARDLRASLPF